MDWRIIATLRPRVLLGLGLGLGSLALATIIAGAVELRRFERAGLERAPILYAAGQFLAPGVDLERIGLAATLARLGYTATRNAPAGPGQFRRSGETWDIALRDAAAADGAAGRVRLDVLDGRVTRLAFDGRDVEAVTLEPEVLPGVPERPSEARRAVSLPDMPRVLVSAVLAVEDHRFFDHGGVDVRAVVRAAWRNLRAGRIVQGGSTITQQLVRMRLLRPRRALLRKLHEMWLASLVEWRYSKDYLLEAYLNEVYLGQHGPTAIRGVGAAARAYFGKDVRQLSLGEAALLAGMIRSPNNYSPAVEPARARARRGVVLDRMRALEMISDADRARARRERVGVQVLAGLPRSAPYFIDHVRRELEQRGGAELAGRGGLHVFTTLDLPLQRFAEQAVARGLDRLERTVPRLRRRDTARRLQAALVALDTETGEIRALVGGRDYRTSQFDRATLAQRQPGSAFKPFVYLTALRARSEAPRVTAASQVEDAPVTLRAGDRWWSPRNDEARYEGRVSVRRALEQSLNAATVRIAMTAGLRRVVETARALGLHGHLMPVPAAALGAFEVTPLGLAQAYLPLANGGRRVAEPSAIRAVDDGTGADVLTPTAPPVRVISPAEAYVMTSLLKGVIASGTGLAARELGIPDTVAGKTGTTNDGRDAWFVGFTPRLLALVWVGFDNGEPHRLSGARAALPIWADFMRHALEAYPQPDFAVPPGVVFVDIDATNGKLAGHACPVVVREAFLAGTEPEPCDEHREDVDHIVGWWMRLTGWVRR